MTSMVVSRLHGEALWQAGARVGLNRPLRARAVQPNAWRRSSLRPFSSQGPVQSVSQASSASFISQASDAVTSAMTPLVPYIEQLPELLHLPPSSHSYAISIAILTVLLRSCITLPATLWQRARTRRMAELVVPQWEKLKNQLPESVARRCRKEGKDYEGYKKELTRELKSELRALTSQHRCSPTITLALPIMVHLPLFISLSLLIRTSLLVAGSPVSMELIPWWSPPSSMSAQFESTAKILADRGMESEALSKLTAVHGPTMAEVDKTMMGPIGLGLLTMTNVELGQWLRRGMISEAEEEEREGEKREAKRQSSKASTDGEEISLAPLRAKLLGNTLRAAAIAFVTVSSQAPAALVVYWLTSASYTLVQNSTFALIDRQRATKVAAAGQEAEQDMRRRL